jgi:hypothetical protein
MRTMWRDNTPRAKTPPWGRVAGDLLQSRGTTQAVWQRRDLHVVPTWTTYRLAASPHTTYKRRLPPPQEPIGAEAHPEPPGVGE